MPIAPLPRYWWGPSMAHRASVEVHPLATGRQGHERRESGQSAQSLFPRRGVRDGRTRASCYRIHPRSNARVLVNGRELVPAEHWDRRKPAGTRRRKPVGTHRALQQIGQSEWVAPPMHFSSLLQTPRSLSDRASRPTIAELSRLAHGACSRGRTNDGTRGSQSSGDG